VLLTLDNRIFGLDPQLLFNLVFQGIAIFLLFMAASRLLLDPVRKILEDRKARVLKEMRDAAADREEAARIKEEYDDKMKNVDRTAEQILSDTRKKAMERESEIIADARDEAARIIKSARQEAELEKKRVKDEVKQEMISVASLMTEKIVAASIDQEKQDALIEETLNEIGDDTWLS
jgi:F-type H+-transporting ATPase subunit b